MKLFGSSLFALLFSGVMLYSAPVESADSANMPKGVKPGVIGAVALNRAGTYCHLRFPAIRVSTLDSKKPQLKPASSHDIIDYYGPCDYNPVGKEEVERQKDMREERMNNDMN